MPTRRSALAAALVVLIAPALPASAQERTAIPVVATFSILGDLVRNVGGDRIQLTTLVGAGRRRARLRPDPRRRPPPRPRPRW